jgi:hypothetical protein
MVIPSIDDRAGSDESVEDLRDRYEELLQEFRVILPSVQIFFAFLLVAPFSATFGELDTVGRSGYALSLAAAAVAVFVLATPTAHHHVGDREARQQRVSMTIRLKFVGLTLVGFASSAGLFVVSRLVFGPVWGWVAGATSCVVWLVLWFLLPMAESGEPEARATWTT